MSALRSVVRKTVGRFGYSISRLRPPVSSEPSTKRQVINAHYKGHRFKCFLGDYLSECILTGKGWDNQLEGILDRVAASGEGDILEIGANIGASLVPIASKYPSLTFHCVEPVPEFFALLEENTQSYSTQNVRLYNLATASEDGKVVEIYTQVGTAGALPHYDNHTLIGLVRVPASTVDTQFGDNNIKLIKLDVDGFEFEILKGAVETLKRWAPLCFIEFHTRIMRQVGVDPYEITRFFAGLGYDQITIYYDGEVLETTDSFEKLVETADSVPYYVDALIEKKSSARLRA